MSSSEKPSSGNQFVRTDVVADAESAATVRREFSDWLRRYFTLDTTKASDGVLAVNEAMANAAEFAYVTAERPGAMHVQADYDGSAATLTVTVTDEGAWRSADPARNELRRGRGCAWNGRTSRRRPQPVTGPAPRTAAVAPPERRTRRSAARRS